MIIGLEMRRERMETDSLPKEPVCLIFILLLTP